MASFIGSRGRLGDPVLLLQGLSFPGSMDDTTYGSVGSRIRASEMPYTDESGYVIRSMGRYLGEEPVSTPWYKTPLAAAGLGFTAGALLCALLKR